MTKTIEAPFLQLGFYFPDAQDSDALAFFINTLIQLDARFAGEVLLQRSPGIRNRPFANVFDDPSERVLMDLSGLQQALEDRDVRVIKVAMDSAVGIAGGKAEIVTFNGISTRAAQSDRHPVVIWTEGHLFSGPFSQENRSEAIEAGSRVYTRFLELARRTSPAYAGITCEYAMECVEDLRTDCRSLAFSDCYISNRYAQRLDREIIQTYLADIHTESLADGIYISCYPFLNPQMKGVDGSRASWISCEIARRISAPD